MNEEQRVWVGATLAATLVEAELPREEVVHVLLRAGLAVLRQYLSCSETASYLREIADNIEQADVSSETVH